MDKKFSIKTNEFGQIKEGEVFCKWLYSRLMVNNKNVLGVELGATGSGKSYRDLRKAELWYQYNFKEKFPTENICFGVSSIMEKLSSQKLRRGEVLIFEEAGANLGSLDFQTKISKMFTYVLQSFRSMNIAIFFNLPYFSMLNKQARMLMHYSFESVGIDFSTKLNRCKPFFLQVNQGTGKVYRKYPRIKINGKIRTIQRFKFAMPSQYLIDAYERKKKEYLENLTKEYYNELKIMEEKKNGFKVPRKEDFDLYKEYTIGGLTQNEIAEKYHVSPKTVFNRIQKIKIYYDITGKEGDGKRRWQN